jgi:hypothetical protein
MYSFKSVQYGKRPTTIYISKNEYYTINPKEKSFEVSHDTCNGIFYVGVYRYKKEVKDIIILRRTFM